jgi:Uma2 family endonuclease
MQETIIVYASTRKRSMGTTTDKTKAHSTYADYCAWSDQRRWELIDGEAFEMTPAPSRSHQDTLRELILEIGIFLRGKPCTIYPSPFDVRLYDSPDQADSQIPTVVQPDLVVICDKAKLDERGCRGAPDLVIEITSPGSISRDLKTKLNLYEKHGVKEYWIVSPSKKTISVFNRNKQGLYGKPIVCIDKEKVRSEVLEGIGIAAGEVFV